MNQTQFISQFDGHQLPCQVNYFPSTRYMGSKRKLLPLLFQVFSELEFKTVLDPFCGTGVVAYLLKCMGKHVTASDVLLSNSIGAQALVQNSTITLGDRISDILNGLPDSSSPAGFVEQTFDGLFFEPAENRFIDQVLDRIRTLGNVQQGIALWSLFQACLIKRPYNLFHRANLYMRTREVKRSFGNKVTWDTPFNIHMKRFAAMADKAIFDSGTGCRALCGNVEDVAVEQYDLVYLDPPYMSSKGVGLDYLDYYHFLEGLCSPECWGKRILHRYKHKPLTGKGENPWCRKDTIREVFEKTIGQFSDSTLVISYRSDGIPSVDEIASMLAREKKKVTILDCGQYIYALSKNRLSREILLIGQ